MIIIRVHETLTVALKWQTTFIVRLPELQVQGMMRQSTWLWCAVNHAFVGMNIHCLQAMRLEENRDKVIVYVYDGSREKQKYF